jgi:hypothetical protein
MLVEDTFNRLHTCSDYYLVLKDESHNQSEQGVIFFIESPVIHRWDTKIKIEAIWWSFHIKHVTNPVTSMKKEAEHEDGATIR